ncbi:MAG: VTT domain-containing protein [Pseudomonadota bacterium]
MASDITVTEMTDTPEKPKKSIFIRLWPVYIILAGLALALSQGWHTYLTPSALEQNAAYLDTLVRENLLLVLAGYIAIYAACTVFIVPASFLTIFGGFLFPVAFGFLPLLGTAATVTGATLGASILFLAAKTSVGEVLRDIAGPFVGKMEKEFNQSPVTYLFVLRLVPALPFAVANIAPALLGAKFRDYVLTTAFGIIPGTLAYTWIGSAIRQVVLEGGSADIGTLSAKVAPALIALFLVSLIPVIYNRFFKKSAAAEGAAE